MELASLILSALGLLVTGGGFYLAWSQLKRTADAAEASADAMRRTEHRMALNHLLVLLPQFRLIESDLDLAAQDGDRKLAIKALVSYAYVASEVAVMLENYEGVDEAFIEELRNTAAAATDAKSNLVSNARTSPKGAAKDVLPRIGQVSMRLAGMAGHFKLQGAG